MTRTTGDTSQPTLRSQAWLAAPDKNGFIARHHLRAMGIGAEAFDKPVIGIANTWSELTPCNAHLRELADAVKRGALAAGGLPLEFPVFSPSEPLMRPTSMAYRNLLAMELEEILRANPIDGVVLLTGCDKTTPGALMGAASVDLPTILLTGGPMLNGRYRGHAVGSGTDIWRMTEELRAGEITQQDFTEFETCLNRSAGHCMTMGTASTMACLAEAMGLQLPDGAALPAVDARRKVLAERTGQCVVDLVHDDVRLSHLLTREAFEDAIRVSAAIGGSTNAVLHLLAIAGRVEVPLDLSDFDALSRNVPLLVDLMPSGRFLMEEFAYAGGVRALLAQLTDRLHLDRPTVAGGTLKESLVGAVSWNPEVIRPRERPVQPAGGVAVLRGNLAPDGAVLKISAASPRLLHHEGRARVFDSLADYLAVVDDDHLDVTADTVLVLRNVGPKGYPGMPEVGNLPLPAVLLSQGVRDMVRISDARMSGTAFGTVLLHAAPEASIGGPLALVRDGDCIRLDVTSRTLQLLVDDDELTRRRAAWQSSIRPPERGWLKLHHDHVLQADRGVDLDFLVGSGGSEPPAPAF